MLRNWPDRDIQTDFSFLGLLIRWFNIENEWFFLFNFEGVNDFPHTVVYTINMFFSNLIDACHNNVPRATSPYFLMLSALFCKLCQQPCNCENKALKLFFFFFLEWRWSVVVTNIGKQSPEDGRATDCRSFIRSFDLTE